MKNVNVKTRLHYGMRKELNSKKVTKIHGCVMNVIYCDSIHDSYYWEIVIDYA